MLRFAQALLLCAAVVSPAEIPKATEKKPDTPGEQVKDRTYGGGSKVSIGVGVGVGGAGVGIGRPGFGGGGLGATGIGAGSGYQTGFGGGVANTGVGVGVGVGVGNVHKQSFGGGTGIGGSVHQPGFGGGIGGGTGVGVGVGVGSGYRPGYGGQQGIHFPQDGGFGHGHGHFGGSYQKEQYTSSYSSSYSKYNYRFPTGSSFYPGSYTPYGGLGAYDRSKGTSASTTIPDGVEIFRESPADYTTTILVTDEVQVRKPEASKPSPKPATEKWNVDCNLQGKDGYILGMMISPEGVEFVECTQGEPEAKKAFRLDTTSTRISFNENNAAEYKKECPQNSILTGVFASDFEFKDMEYGKCTNLHTTSPKINYAKCEDIQPRQVRLPPPPPPVVPTVGHAGSATVAEKPKVRVARGVGTDKKHPGVKEEIAFPKESASPAAVASPLRVAPVVSVYECSTGFTAVGVTMGEGGMKTMRCCGPAA